MEFRIELNWKSFLALGVASSMIILTIRSRDEESGSLLLKMFNTTESLFSGKDKKEIVAHD